MRLTYCTLQNSKMLIWAILKRTTLSNHVFKQLTIWAGSITFCHNNAFILKMQDPKKILHCHSLRRIQVSHRFTQRCFTNSIQHCCWFLENFYFLSFSGFSGCFISDGRLDTECWNLHLFTQKHSGAGVLISRVIWHGWDSCWTRQGFDRQKLVISSGRIVLLCSLAWYHCLKD